MSAGTIRRRLGTVAKLALSLGVLAVVAARTDLALVRERLATADSRLVAAALLLLFARNAIQAWRWQLLLRAWSRPLSLGLLVRLVMIGGFFTLLLPTAAGGDLARWALLARGRLERSFAAQSVLGDRLAGLWALGVLAALAMPWAWNLVPGPALQLAVLAVVPMAAAALAAVLQPGWLPARWRDRLALEPVRSGRVLVAVGAVSLLAHATAIAAMVCLGRAVDDPTPALVYAALLPLVWLVSLAPISLGGLGVREAGFVSLMTAAGMPAATAVAVAGLWLVTTLAQAAVGGVLLMGAHRTGVSRSNAFMKDVEDRVVERIASTPPVDQVMVSGREFEQSTEQVATRSTIPI